MAVLLWQQEMLEPQHYGDTYYGDAYFGDAYFGDAYYGGAYYGGAMRTVAMRTDSHSYCGRRTIVILLSLLSLLYLLFCYPDITVTVVITTVAGAL